MKFSRIVVVIVSLGVNANGESCKDSTLEIETESGSRFSCSDLTADVDCLQPNIASHCKKLCKVSFCCADSQAKFGVIVPGKKKPKYTSCDSKKLNKHCGVAGVEETCPVMCGTCNPIDGILLLMTEQEEAMKEQVRINKEQQDMIDILGTTGFNEYVCGDYLYKISGVGGTWNQHEAAAVEWGGHLASIHSADENDCIVNMIRVSSYPETSFYIGLKRNEKEQGQFEYIDETDFDFSDWSNGQPDNKGGYENVVELRGEYGLKWNDVRDEVQGGVYKTLNPNLPM